MDRQEGFSTNRAPLFDGSNYALWSIRMKHYLMALGFDIWSAVKNGYTTPTTPPIDTTGKRLSDNNSKAIGAILNGLEDSVFVKVMHCTSTKEMWDKLQKIYEGDDKVKKEKLQTHRGQFETLKMNEEESIATYFLHVDDIVNTIRGLGEEVKETIIVQKVLRSLPSRFNPKISSIEEIHDLDNLTMDELHGILTAYEMRIEQDKPTNPSRKEATFKESKKIKTK
jgi:hypothetical protein